MHSKITEKISVGQLAYISQGIRHKVCLIVGVQGSIYIEGLINYTYIVLIDGQLKKYKGWKLQPIEQNNC